MKSIAWAYAAGSHPYREDTPLDGQAEGNRAITVDRVIALERQILGSPQIEGVVLRYGRLYGRSTGVDAPDASMLLHVDAAYAALLAVDSKLPGVFNIAEPNDEVAAEKAFAQLGVRRMADSEKQSVILERQG